MVDQKTTEVSGFVDDNPNINQLISQNDIIQSNSMVESINKHIKYYYLFKKELKILKIQLSIYYPPFLITTINLMEDYMALPLMKY